MTNYLNVKNGIEILHANGLTQILAGGVDPTTVGVTASVGSIFLRSDNSGGIYTKTTEVDTGWSLIGLNSSSISIEQHIALHNSNKYIEFSYDQGKVIQMDEWLDSSKTHQISSTAIDRVDNRVSVIIKALYDYLTGTSVIATITGTITRFDNKVQSITYSRDNTIGGL